MKTLSFSSFMRVCLLSAVVSLFFPASLAAQTTAARPDRGIMPGASYSVSDIENINLSNGNVQVTIPLASLPPIAGGKLKLTLNATYNSKLWNITRTEHQEGTFFGCPTWVVDTPQESDLGGWVIAAGYRIVFRTAQEDFDYVIPNPPPTQDCETNQIEQAELQHQFYRTVLIGPDGAEHELRPLENIAVYGGFRSYLGNYYKGTPDTLNVPTRYYSFDGSYIWATINPSSHSTRWTITLKDGTRVVQYSNGIQRITDTNGNSIKIFSDANGTHYQDEQTGREIRFGADNKVWYQKPGGAWDNVTIVWGTTTVQGKLYRVNNWVPTGGETGGGSYCWHDQVLQSTLPVIREIIFPQTQPGQPAQRYSFSYNSDETTTASNQVAWSCGGPGESYNRTVSKGLGSLSQITTPTGAIVKYSYSKDSKHNFSLFGDTDDIARETLTQKQVIHDGVTDTWTYNIIEFNACGGTVTAPDGSVTTETCYPKDAANAQFFGNVPGKAGLTYRSNRSNVELVERHWTTTLVFTGANQLSTGSFANVTFNPLVDAEYTTLLDNTPSHNPVKMSAKTFQYDYNGNLTQTKEYDWFDPALVSRDAQGVPTGVPASATLLRTTNHSYYNGASSSTSANVYAKRAITTGTPLVLNALQQTTVGPGIVQFSYDGQAYGVAPTGGNLTTKKVWVDLESKWITTSNTYGLYGNLATSTDGRGKVTQFFYDDATHALPNRVVVDPQNGTGTQTTTTAYDYHTGLVTNQTDANNQISTIDYTNQLLGTIDPFGRPGITIAPQINIGGTNYRRSVTTTYLDSARQVIVATDLNAESDQLLKTRTTVDQLGRPVLTEQTENGTSYTISAVNKYLDMGRVTLTSSSRRSTAASTDSWTRVTKDNAGRVIEVATFGGATQPAWTGTTGVFTGAVMTAYGANFTTVTDQAGKVRRSMVDALGRLRRIDEPDASNNLGTTASPVQPTSYAYDVFGNLTTVTQGTQTRTFTYDSLSRLRTAGNPESGTISYQYDDNGNLLVKTDARNVSTHFAYDSINRLTRRWYNGSNLVTSTTHNNPALPSGVGVTDEAKFFYDTQSLPTGAPSYSRGAAIGRLVAQTYGAGSNGDYHAFDGLGRTTLKIQQTGTINYQMSAVYNLSALTTLTYPSGRTVTHTYDQAGRLTALSGNLGDGTTRTYATGILYSPTGGLVKEQFGTATPVYNKLFYNSRGQLAEIRASTGYTGPTDTTWDRGAIINSYSNSCTGVCSGSSMSDNNGNLRKQQIYIPGHTMRWQEYDYDSLNRLNWAREVLDGGAEQWKQQFTYDRWGNRTINTGATYGTGINNKAFTINTANNRLGVPVGQSGAMTYDAAGNLTNDTYTGSGIRTYDAENKITSAWGGNNQAQLYAYDSSGQRIKRTVDGVHTWQVYGFTGELLAEYRANGAVASPQKEYGYRNGQLLVTADAETSVNGYAYRRTITIDHTKVPNISQSNFPVMISGTYAYLATTSNGGNVQNANGYDVIFSSDAGCASKLDHEVETYSATTGAVTYWVRVPLLSHTSDTTIYLCYGNSGITTDQSNKTGVWDSNFKAVYHLNDQAANTIVTDSTANGSHGVNAANTSAKTVSGKLGRALTYNGSSDNTATGVTQTSSFTWECWFKLTAWTTQSGSSNYSTLLAGVYGSGGALLMLWKDSGWLVQFAPDNVGGVTSDASSITPGVWRHAALTRTGNSGTYALYLDGQLEGQVASGTNNSNSGITLGTRADFLAQALNGLLDETRISNVARSADWLKTQYTNQSSPATFYTVSGAATGGASDVRWLVADHLGTPRMILDQTGSLANMKRHDYLPFGEELFAPTSGRSAAQGYASGDGVRQQFTLKERDVETGLDYFLARYYSSVQGRFTSPDEFVGGPDELFYFAQDAAENPTFYAELANPQSLNKYQYCLNNPLRYIDPDGHQQQDGKSSNIVDRLIKSVNEILGSLFASLQRGAGKDGAPEEMRRPGPYGNGDQIIQAYMDRVGESTETTMDVMMLFDVTGAGGASRSLLNYQFRDGDKADLAISYAAVVLARGGGPIKIGFSEAKSLVGAWGSGTFHNLSRSITYHFGKHGADVGASDVWQYLRKAEGFARNLRGAKVTELDDGARRYVKNGYYLIKDKAGKILSYGRVNE